VYKKIVFLAFASAMLFSTVLDAQFKKPLSYASSNENLTWQESQVMALINGTNIYNYDLKLEKIALNHSISNYAFRSGGSEGATATAMWLKAELESLGLETHLEAFEFTNWNLPSQPILIIDEDGDSSTTNDQTPINSFQSEHYSWPTPEEGVFANLVVLPLPSTSNFNEISLRSINKGVWNSINITGKIVLIGREVRWNPVWEETFYDKLRAQTPLAVIYTWWNYWMAFAPPFFSSIGGRPTSNLGPYDWNLKIPVGWVNYEDGLWIRNKYNVSAKVTIHSIIGTGPHYNVVGRLQGHANPDKLVIVSGHYDTVMTSGLVDNGAGTAGVIELARIFAEAAKKGLYNPDYTILFIAFASEELGLVGSTNYVMQHKADMKNIVAVINLDCIGSDSLYVTQTEPSKGLDFDEVILKAAGDLSINATLTDPGGSDQEVFRNPAWADNSYSWWWPGLTSGISNATRVESSTMLLSYPLLYSDKWNRMNPGWIHTSYDNSTSTQTLNWLEPNHLEEQIRVAALSTMRISGSPSFSFPLWALGVGVAVAAVVVVVTVVIFVKRRKPPVKDVGGGPSPTTIS